ncbi:MAG: hypothetical protein N3I35_06815 [Clostridia bacterium]|nr:hypothetical protein [Clostridia bacterium]
MNIPKYSYYKKYNISRLSYLKWLYRIKVLKQKVCIGIDLQCNNGIWTRGYIDYDGEYKVTVVR